MIGAGANPASLGARRLAQLAGFGFAGRLTAVNPDGADSGGVPGAVSVASIPEPVDLAVVAVPHTAVAAAIADCAEAGIPVAQVLSAGPHDPAALKRFERDLVAAGRGITRIVGPNCVGTHSSAARTTFVARPDARVGSVAFVSQSGGLSVDFLNQARDRGVGVSRVVSIGNSADLGFPDFLDFLASDDATAVICLYLEGIDDGPALLSSLRRTTAEKPVIVLKGGRTEEGSRTASSHTGSVTSSWEIFAAAVHQAGAVTVASFDELLAAATALQSGIPPIESDTVAVVGNGGGMSVLITDTLAENGMRLADLDVATLRRFDEVLDLAGATLGNPTDMPAGALAKMPEDDLRTVISALRDDPGIGSLIVHWNLLPFLGYPDPDALVRKLAHGLASAVGSMPVVVGLRSTFDPDVVRLRGRFVETCLELGIPVFRDGIEAAWALAIARRVLLLRRRAAGRGADLEHAPSEQRIVSAEATLSQAEAMALFESSGIPVAPAVECARQGELDDACRRLRPPWVMKLEVPGLLHKSDIGGVALDVRTVERAREVFDDLVALGRRHGAERPSVFVQEMVVGDGTELFVGVTRDDQFGHVLAVGVGGVLVEAFQSVATRVLPASRDDFRAMLGEFRGAALFEGYRGSTPWDVEKLADLLERVSALVQRHPEIRELDINPILRTADTGTILAVDAVVVVDDADSTDGSVGSHPTQREGARA